MIPWKFVSSTNSAYNFEAILRAVEGLQMADARLLDAKLSDILPDAGISNVLH